MMIPRNRLISGKEVLPSLFLALTLTGNLNAPFTMTYLSSIMAPTRKGISALSPYREPTPKSKWSKEALMSARRLMDHMRAAIRLHHYSRRAEDAYVRGIKRFILFNNKRHPDEQRRRSD